MKITFLSSKLAHQQGRGNAGCFFGLLMVLILGYLGYKFLHHYVNHYQLKDAMKEIAVYHAAGLGSRSVGPGANTEIQDAVLKKAKDLEIPLRRENINVRREGDVVFITVSYTIPVELPGLAYVLNFEFTSHN